MADSGGVRFNAVTLQLPDGRRLLEAISLDLQAGTTTALLGRSGSGKTTLLRTVNGLVRPTGGDVWVAGRDVRTADPIALRRGIGYVIQETGLFPHMTAQRNVGMALELAGRPKPEIAGRAEQLFAMVGLPFADLRARYPWQISGGQRQRLGLARALASDPPVLLMDEPFGALDPMTRAEMQTMLRDLLAQVGKTVLIVTHDLDEALFLAHRVVLLAGGRVVADLPAAQVMASEHPDVREYVRAVHRAGDPSPPPRKSEGTA